MAEGLDWRLIAILIAMIMDGLLGEPDFLWRHMPHPVVMFGKVIDAADRWFNRDAIADPVRRLLGIVFALVLAIATFMIGRTIELLLGPGPIGAILIGAVGSIFIAQNSLHAHVDAVADALDRGGLKSGRKAVAMIVGRDPETLDEPGVSRAAVESCAENFADGVVAPIFWFALLGLGGLFAYKAINTADSMIGHQTPKHAAFGMGAARLDDLVNLIPARIAGLLVAFAAPRVGGSILTGLKTMVRDAGKHRSPNAGWPEAAMAGGLGVALAGPRIYDGALTDDPFLNAAGSKTADAKTIRRSLEIMVGACWGVGILVALHLAAVLLV
ncbi:MAG: adenosylcobinamide-phosphate synthase CbiB [Pseudomonadota bacterium]